MILYFSATGNCRHIAQKIAAATYDRAVSMTEVTAPIVLQEGESLGLVTPTYFWGLPSYVKDFLQGMSVTGGEEAYCFCVATYGTTVGQVEHFVRRLLREKGLPLSAGFGIKTVDNWSVWFPVNDQAAIRRTLEEEAAQTAAVVEQIRQKQRVFIQKDKKPLFACKVAGRLYEKARRTSHLRVTGDCIGCGQCAENCPVQAIEMANGIPRWHTAQCVMCLGCLHRCPTFAIQYDNKTQKNGQYLHPQED